ncbi:hypothetical protein PGTUg99_017979 [Puccinia graminis f. sp. tritici]|uniref:Fungal-type protein kinase domain-containing protein n=1 Tax=Puccinia graminis f. sp. tritici TaxID=56615 RepID=A0A5B0RVM0_PUCGR|nr:hypothetical protein PGTUg99_017979 [Puccinia graminis f. sp. tritici]
MHTEPGNLHISLRNHLASLRINTFQEFFGLDRSIIKQQIPFLCAQIINSDIDSQCRNAIGPMLSLHHDGCFEPFKPLIAVTLADKAKSNQEMLKFIEEEFGSPPTPLPFIPTPLRTGTTSSLTNSSDLLRHFMPRLRQELQGLMYNNVPGLVEHFIQQRTFDPALRLEPDESFIDEKYEETLKDTTEGSMLDWFTSFFDQVVKQSPQIRNSRTWKSQPTIPLKGLEAIRKLDGAIMSVNLENENRIEDVMIPLELKMNKSDASKAAMSLAKYVCHLFKAQPTRIFVIGFALCGTWMQLWQFDRSGAIGSEFFDIKANKKNLKKFFTLISWSLTCDKRLLGFDPTFIVDESPVIRIQTQAGEFVIDEPENPIFRASGICGRGTTCWKAHLAGDERQKFLIKDSWQPDHRREEGLMLRDVTQKNVHHVARYYHHEDVHVSGQRVDIESHVRGGTNFQSGQTIQINEMPDDAQVLNQFINRVHRRLVLKDVGKPISEANSPVELLEALEGCIKGHQALLNAGYLHRDISINNLMIDNQTADSDRKAFLIDLDVAIPYDVSNKDYTRTGTKVFLSISLLQKCNPHDFADDLESFFWVMIWICIHFPRAERKQTSVTSWNEQIPENLGSIKKDLLSEPSRLTNDFTARYKQSQPLIQCVHDFAKIMQDPAVRKKNSTQLYGEILNIFQQARGKLSQSSA